MKISTLCVQLPPGNDPYGATAPPIYQTATFRQPANEARRPSRGRMKRPVRVARCRRS